MITTIRIPLLLAAMSCTAMLPTIHAAYSVNANIDHEQPLTVEPVSPGFMQANINEVVTGIRTAFKEQQKAKKLEYALVRLSCSYTTGNEGIDTLIKGIAQALDFDVRPANGLFIARDTDCVLYDQERSTQFDIRSYMNRLWNALQQYDAKKKRGTLMVIHNAHELFNERGVVHARPEFFRLTLLEFIKYTKPSNMAIILVGNNPNKDFHVWEDCVDHLVTDLMEKTLRTRLIYSFIYGPARQNMTSMCITAREPGCTIC